jgi:hypothetical protein
MYTTYRAELRYEYAIIHVQLAFTILTFPVDIGLKIPRLRWNSIAASATWIIGKNGKIIQHIGTVSIDYIFQK